MLEKGNHCFLLSMCLSLSGFFFSFFFFSFFFGLGCGVDGWNFFGFGPMVSDGFNMGT